MNKINSSYLRGSKPTKICIVVFFTLVALNESAQATDYYVATTGSDTNAGTLAAPFKTVTQALTTYVAGTGGTIYMRAGIYNEEVMITKSGNNNTPLILKPFNSESVTFNGSSITVLNGIIEANNCSYVTISGLKIQNVLTGADAQGIRVQNSQNIIIENNDISNLYSSGIGIWGQHVGDNTSDIIVRNNKIVNANDGGPNENISIGGANRFWVYGNELYEQGVIDHSGGGEGIDIKQGSRNGYVYSNYIHNKTKIGIYVDAWNKHTYNIEIYRNLIQDNDSGIAIASERSGEVDNILIHNNVIVGCGLTSNRNAITLDTYDNGSPTPKVHPIFNVAIFNNTVSNNYNNIMVNERQSLITTDAKNYRNVLIQNNLIEGKTGSYNIGSRALYTSVTPSIIYRVPYTVGDFTVHYNAIRIVQPLSNAGVPYFMMPTINTVSLTGTTALTGAVSIENLTMNSIIGLEDAGFGTANSIKYIITNFSDDGVLIPVEEKTAFLNNFEIHFAQDFNGHPRISGTGIDIGAVEYQANIFSLIATTNAATNVAVTGATLNGNVISDGATATASFDFGSNTDYGEIIAAVPSQIYSGTAVAISADQAGLVCNTTYNFRAKAVTSVDTSYGVDQTFTTAACVTDSGLCGDSDGNRAVNIVDALAIARKLVGLPPPPTIDDLLADTNENGRLDINDALFIARYSIGLLLPPEVCAIGLPL